MSFSAPLYKSTGSYYCHPDVGMGFGITLLSFTTTLCLCDRQAGLPQSGKKNRKMKFYLGQGKVRAFCGWPWKLRKDLESQGKVREFENKWLWHAVFRKFIYSVQDGKGGTFS